MLSFKAICEGNLYTPDSVNVSVSNGYGNLSSHSLRDPMVFPPSSPSFCVTVKTPDNKLVQVFPL